MLACVSAPVVFGVSGCFGDELSEVWHELMVSLDIRVPRGGSGGGEVYSPIMGGGRGYTFYKVGKGQYLVSCGRLLHGRNVIMLSMVYF